MELLPMGYGEVQNRGSVIKEIIRQERSKASRFDRVQNRDSIIKKIVVSFFRLNIAKKMLLGYLPLALLIILLAVFALSSLRRLNKINNSIIETDVPLVEAADKMIDNLLAQELYGRRYVILKSSDMLELFWKRSEEFDTLIAQIHALPGRKDIPIDQLASLHKEYNNLFINGLKYLEKPSSSLAEKHDGQIKEKQEELIQLIKKVSSEARRSQNEKTLMIASIVTSTFRLIAVLCILGIILGISAAILITRSISGSVNQLKLATQQISEGRFDHMPNIKSRDELGELSSAFSEMAKRLKRLEEMYLDASPLTRLPGGVAIENILKKRLDAGIPIAFCLVDMNNFKSFNDRYGYARGNEVINATARIIEAAVAQHGTDEDFIGHIGGDDFVIVTSPERYGKICSIIIEAFDKMILDSYDPEDRNRGYIIGKTRQGQEMFFPIITLSISVVTNQSRELKSHIQIGEIAAELKGYAKSLPGSTYVVDRRRESS